MWNKKLISEILNAHADQPLGLPSLSQDYLKLFPNDVELTALLNLADHLRLVFQAGAPSQSFKAQLKQELLEAAQQQEETKDENPSKLGFIRPSVILTTLFGTGLAIAGVVAAKIYLTPKLKITSPESPA